MLFRGNKFQWERLSHLIQLAKEGGSDLDLSDTVSDGARLVLTDPKLRSQLIMALTEDNRLHLDVRTPPPPLPPISPSALLAACSPLSRQVDVLFVRV